MSEKVSISPDQLVQLFDGNHLNKRAWQRSSRTELYLHGMSSSASMIDLDVSATPDADEYTSSYNAAACGLLFDADSRSISLEGGSMAQIIFYLAGEDANPKVDEILAGSVAVLTA